MSAVPMILPNGDTARARLTDPLSSHVGGDRSAEARHQVRVAVAHILGSIVDCADGNRINDLYHRHAASYGWPDVHWDAPRKRAGEMEKDGELIVLNADDPRGVPRSYCLPENLPWLTGEEPPPLFDTLAEYHDAQAGEDQ